MKLSTYSVVATIILAIVFAAFGVPLWAGLAAMAYGVAQHEIGERIGKTRRGPAAR